MDTHYGYYTPSRLRIGVRDEPFVQTAASFRFLRTSENPFRSDYKMFCTLENKCMQSLIEFTQDPGSCNSPIGRQMNELNRIQRTHLFFLIKMVHESMVDS